MTEQPLEVCRGIPSAGFVGSAGVSKRMTTKFLGDPRKPPVFLDNIHDASNREPVFLVVEEHMLIQATWPVGKVGSQGLGCFPLKIDGALLVAFAVNQHRASVQVNVRQRE